MTKLESTLNSHNFGVNVKLDDDDDFDAVLKAFDVEEWMATPNFYDLCEGSVS